MNRNRRNAFKWALCLWVLLPAFSATSYATPKAVVELFTSQGCSSCPPADRLLEDLSASNDILGLSLPVDYWDYLGWKDTLASRANTNRQRGYATQRGDRAIYTPQMVINGTEHVVGSNTQAVSRALDQAEPLPVSVSLSVNDMAVEAKVSGLLPKGPQMATVFFGMLAPRKDVPIGRGENAGRTVTYVNVVHHLQPIGMWSGGDSVFRMPKSEVKFTGMTACVVLVQLETDLGPGRIIAANTLDWGAKATALNDTAPATTMPKAAAP